jgi:anti-anti-sigma factor
VPLLNVALVPAPDQVVVRLTGEADLSSAPQLSDALVQAGGLGTRQVVVDVAGVRFWDLSGLYALTGFTAELAAEGRSCRVVGAPAATRRLIGLASLAADLNLDGPLRELPAPVRPAPARRPVHEHPVRPRAQALGDLVAVGGGSVAPDRRPWRRRG